MPKHRQQQRTKKRFQGDGERPPLRAGPNGMKAHPAPKEEVGRSVSAAFSAKSSKRRSPPGRHHGPRTSSVLLGSSGRDPSINAPQVNAPREAKSVHAAGQERRKVAETRRRALTSARSPDKKTTSSYK